MPRPIQQRQSTRFPGVYWVQLRNDNRAFFIRYRLVEGRRQVEERAGTSATGMTAAKAAMIRAERLTGKSTPNSDRRKNEKATQEASKWTLNQLWETYVEIRSSEPSKPYKGLRHDRNRFNAYFGPIAELRPEQLDSLTYERWRRKIAQGRSPTTVWHCGELLRRIVRFGTDRSLCQALPFKLKLSKPDNRTTEYLQPDQLASLLRAFESEPPVTANFFRFILLTGLRRSEAIKLQWDDIDFERAEILLRETKAGKDQLLPLSQGAITLLKNHVRHENAPQLVFPTPNGNLWNCRSLGRVFARIRQRAELPKGFRLVHGLRHQYGSMLAENGANIVELRDLLRHSDVRVSERYLHSNNERLRQVANKLGDQLDKIAITGN